MTRSRESLVKTKFQELWGGACSESWNCSEIYLVIICFMMSSGNPFQFKKYMYLQYGQMYICSHFERGGESAALECTAAVTLTFISA